MKIKPITLCAVVNKLKPKLSYFELFQKCDAKRIVLKKGEKIIPVEVIAKI